MSIEEQLTQTYEDAREDIYRYLLTFGLDAAVAQDCTHEAFLRLYTEMRRGVTIESPRGWLFRTAHRLAIDWTRQFAREKQHEADIPIPPPTNREMDRARNMRSVREMLLQLSPQQKRCLYLRAEGLKYREIAEQLGIELSTVSSFIERALSKLRKGIHG